MTDPWRRTLPVLSLPGLTGTPIVLMSSTRPMLPLEPLWRTAVMRWGALPSDLLAERPAFTRLQFAAMVDVHDTAVYVWKREGVPMFAADAAATALGLHPQDIWDEWTLMCELLWHERWDEWDDELEAVA